jgi:hypothetical protein
VPPDAIIVNEWIFHDIKGDNGPRAQECSESFLEALIAGPYQIVVLRNSKWTEKAWALWKQNDARVQVLSKLLYLGILVDSRKCIYLNHDEVQPLPESLAAQVPADDVYLFQSAIATGARTIVTTDQRLIDMVTTAADHGIRLRLRDDYSREELDLPQGL